MLKQLKNNKGFTLVEVIVVAVIVLILAAVAIPLYNGYIKDSRIASVENAAVAIASGLGAMVQTNGNATAADISTTSVNADHDGTHIVMTATPTNVNTILLPKDMRLSIDYDGGTVVVTHGRATDAIATAKFR